MDIPNWTSLELCKNNDTLYVNYARGVLFFRFFFSLLSILCCVALYIIRSQKLIPDDLMNSAQSILAIILLIFTSLTFFFFLKKYPNRKQLLTNKYIDNVVLFDEGSKSISSHNICITVFLNKIKGDEFGFINVIISNELEAGEKIFSVSDLSYNLNPLKLFCEYNKFAYLIEQ